MNEREDLHSYWLSHSTEEEEVVVMDEDVGDTSNAELIVYNDNHNTFDHVIACFVKILQHTEQQAEQLSLMIHFNGKATVKTAPFKILKPYKDALVEKGLSAVIER